MNLKKLVIYTILFPVILLITVSCDTYFTESDSETFQLVSFYDLRGRETFVQITNTGGTALKTHVQVFNVANNCNENNFFDNMTGNDTHVYNLRDIQTNNGNPSGLVLPANAYGIVVITVVDSSNSPDAIRNLIGNFRILDSTGYEYRTNSLGGTSFFSISINGSSQEYYLNFNQKGGVVLSDVIGFTLDNTGFNFGTGQFDEVFSTDIVDINVLVDVDIFDLDENIFSCRNVIFACTDQDNPRLEELLEDVGGANVASFEYGINEAIPHSKGDELLCPGNVIGEGIVRFRILGQDAQTFGVYVGLNNGNGRGSMDSFWDPNVPLINSQNGGMDASDM